MKQKLIWISIVILALSEPGHAQSPIADSASLLEAEKAFASAMAERNFSKFASFIDDQAIFIGGGSPIRGKKAILAHWRSFFSGREAPFSWRPEVAEISSVNHIGYTQGPVSNGEGKVVATFASTWRLGGDGKWKVVFDSGFCVCERPLDPAD